MLQICDRDGDKTMCQYEVRFWLQINQPTAEAERIYFVINPATGIDDNDLTTQVKTVTRGILSNATTDHPLLKYNVAVMSEPEKADLLNSTEFLDIYEQIMDYTNNTVSEDEYETTHWNIGSKIVELSHKNVLGLTCCKSLPNETTENDLQNAKLKIEILEEMQFLDVLQQSKLCTETSRLVYINSDNGVNAVCTTKELNLANTDINQDSNSSLPSLQTSVEYQDDYATVSIWPTDNTLLHSISLSPEVSSAIIGPIVYRFNKIQGLLAQVNTTENVNLVWKAMSFDGETASGIVVVKFPVKFSGGWIVAVVALLIIALVVTYYAYHRKHCQQKFIIEKKKKPSAAKADRPQGIQIETFNKNR